MTERAGTRGVGLIVVALIVAAGALFLLFEMDLDFLPVLTIPDPTGIIRAGFLSIAVVALVWVILQVVGRVFERVTVARGGSHAHVRSVWKLVSYLVWAVVLVALLLGLLGDVTSTALGLGLFGAVLAFVLQKPLLNAAGWLVITYRQMFRIGDRISTGQVHGYVTDIRLMHTEVQEFGEWMAGDTFTGRLVAIPNAVVFDGPIFNYTRDFPFIWDEVGNLVTFESDIELAKRYMLDSATEVVGELMAENYRTYGARLEIRDLEKLLLRGPEIRLHFSDSGVNMYVLYFCPAEVRRKVKTEITDRIWRRFMADPRVGIAYPHMEFVPHERDRERPDVAADAEVRFEVESDDPDAT